MRHIALAAALVFAVAQLLRAFASIVDNQSGDAIFVSGAQDITE